MRADVPPQALEAEESVLGAMLLAPAAIETVADILDPADFYRESHGRIYRAALQMYARNEPVDAITLTGELEQRGELDSVGGRVRIRELARLVPAAANVAHYAGQVRETATLRSLIRAGGEIASLGWERDGDACERAEQIVYDVSKHRYRPLPDFNDDLQQAVLHLRKIAESPGKLTGTASGLLDLDAITHGFQPGNLIVLAARPGMGKSALALCIAHDNVTRGVPVYYGSLEMSRQELMQRLLSVDSGVPVKTMRRGSESMQEWARIELAESRLQDAPFRIDDDGFLRPHRLRGRVRREIKQRGNVGLVIVDYLQLMVDGKAEHLVAETGRVSHALKELAKDLAVPVLALAQLNRGVEQRADKRPALADLRDSGAIEQDADVVMLLYRDEYYDPSTVFKNMAELRIAKHRNGDTGLVELRWDKELTKFTNLTKSTSDMRSAA